MPSWLFLIIAFFVGWFVSKTMAKKSATG